MNELEQLRQNMMFLNARMGAIETLSRALFAIICSYDASPQMLDKLEQGIFPLLLRQAAEKKYEGTPAELAQWLVNQEVEILKREFDAILLQIDEMRKTAHRNIQ